MVTSWIAGIPVTIPSSTTAQSVSQFFDANVSFSLNTYTVRDWGAAWKLYGD